MATKLIYGVGRIPKASEFALGDIIVNVDDSKIFSKNKSNIVFEVGSNITNTVESQAFTTASLHSGSFNASLTASASPNLVISGGVGIEILTGSQVNSIILNATGETIASVLVANTASYVQAGNIDGTINISTQTNFNTLDTTGQTAIDLTFPSNTNILTATAPNLDTTSNVQFNSITSSTDISASGDIIASRFIASGSNVTSGFVFPNPENLTDLNSNRITLTSAQNMQFRAGNVFQFTKTVEILNSESLMLKNADNNGRVLLENAGVGNESRFRIRTGSVELVTVSGSGNVGIGKATPGEKLEVSGSISASNDLISNRLLVDDGNASTPSIVFASEPDTGIYRPAPNNLSIQVDGGSSPAVEFNFNPNKASLSTPLDIQGGITASGDISASGLLFVSASQPAAHTDSIVAVVYDTGSGQFFFTGSYGGGGTNINGTDKQVLFFNGNDNPVGDEGFTYDKDLNSITLTGDITSSNALFPGNGAGIQLGNSAGSNSIKFVPGLNANSAFTGEVSALANSPDFKQSLNFFNLSDQKHISLSIGESEYFKANFAQGAKADKAFIINGDDDSVDFIVSGSNFPDLLVAGVDSDNVGIGFGSSSLSTPYGSSKLAVSGSAYFLGNITSSGTIALKPDSSANEQSEISFHNNEVKIVFEKDNTAGFPFSTQSINFLSDGEKLMSVGSRGGSTKRVIINPDNDSGVNTFFNVRGGTFGDDNLIITNPVYNSVGMGVNPNVSATSTSGSKLIVKGNISASGFLRLAPTGSETALAGALLYSASNEFYLGFS